MKWDIFKKLLKKEIHDYPSEVDPMEIWKAIEPGVDALNQKKKKKRRGIIWWFLAGSLVIGATGYLILGQQTEGAIEGSEGENSKRSSLPIEQRGVESAVTPVKEPSNQENIRPEANTNTTKPMNSAAATNTNSTNPDSFHSSDSKPAIFGKTKNNGVQAFNEEKEEKEWNSNQEGPIVMDTAFAELENAPLHATEGNTKKAEKGKGRLTKLDYLARLTPELNDQLTPSLDNIDELKESLAKEQNESGRRNESTFSVGITALGGVSFARKKLASKEGYDEPLLALREDTETSLEASHYGALVTLRHRSGIEISTGIQQTTINERFDYLHQDVRGLIVEGVQARYVNINGDTIDIMGEIPITRTTDYDLKVYNKYRLLEIPLLIGYSIQMDDWAVGAQAGVFANLALKTSGRILKDPGVFWDLDTEQEEVFSSSIGLSYHLGLSVRRQLFPNIELSFAPFVRIYPDFTWKDYTISQKYTLFGGNVGLIYRIGGK